MGRSVTLLALTLLFLLGFALSAALICGLLWIWRLPAEEKSPDNWAGFPIHLNNRMPERGIAIVSAGHIYWLDPDTFTGPAGWPPKPTVFYDQERDNG
jgi:hypothetical protein